MNGKIIIGLILLAFGFTACQQEPKDGKELIAKMQKKWDGNMPDQMTFKQRTVFYNPDGKVNEEQMWDIAVSSPDRMHIRINGFETGNGMLFKEDSAFYFQNQQMLAADAKVHYLLVLSYSIFVQEASVTISQLEVDGFNMHAMYSGEFNGRDAYYVGIDSLGRDASYFVVDKEDLVVLQTVRKRSGNVFEVNFNSYKDVEGHYMATELLFRQEGVQTMTEHYEQIQFPEQLDEKLFSTKTFFEGNW